MVDSPFSVEAMEKTVATFPFYRFKLSEERRRTGACALQYGEIFLNLMDQQRSIGAISVNKRDNSRLSRSNVNL